MNKTVTEWVVVDSIVKSDLTDGTVVFLSNDPNAYVVEGDKLVWDNQPFPLSQFSDHMERGDGKFAYATFTDGIVRSLVKKEDAFPIQLEDSTEAA